MAEVLRGKKKGQNIKIRQFCNDWFMMEDGSIMGPTNLRFDMSEIMQILDAAKKKQCGIMFGLFEFKGDRMARRKRER